MSGRSQEAHAKVWEGSGGPLGGLIGVGRPTHRSERDWLAH